MGANFLHKADGKREKLYEIKGQLIKFYERARNRYISLSQLDIAFRALFKDPLILNHEAKDNYLNRCVCTYIPILNVCLISMRTYEIRTCKCVEPGIQFNTTILVLK